VDTATASEERGEWGHSRWQQTAAFAHGIPEQIGCWSADIASMQRNDLRGSMSWMMSQRYVRSGLIEHLNGEIEGSAAITFAPPLRRSSAQGPRRYPERRSRKALSR